MRRTPDQSLFAWTKSGLPDPLSRLHEPGAIDGNIEPWKFPSHHPFFASSPCFFPHGTGIRALSQNEVARRLQLCPNELPTTDYAFTPHGVRTELPVISFSDYFSPERIHNSMHTSSSQWYLVVLGCEHDDFPGHLLARLCHIECLGSSVEYLHAGRIRNSLRFDLLPLSLAALAHFHSSGGRISIKTLYIPQPERDQGERKAVYQEPHETIKLVLIEKTRRALSAQGYTATLRCPDNAHPCTHSVTLDHDTHTITIDYHHTLDYELLNRYRERLRNCQRLTIKAHVKTSGLVLQDSPCGFQVPSHWADGLGSRVFWTDVDSTQWKEELYVQDIELASIPGGPMALTIRLGLTLARTNHYILRIGLKTPDPVPPHPPMDGIRDALGSQSGF